ncbi:hypothetical protein ACU4GD_39350 [Cupriavidus basilensis]
MNLVTGGDASELAGDGLFLDHARTLRSLGRVHPHLARGAGGQP